MQTRKLGRSAVDVSAIGFGTMSLSLEDRPPEAAAIEVLCAALDEGIRLIDTADVYALDDGEIGHGERLIAKALREWAGDASDVVVATKGGIEHPGALNQARFQCRPFVGRDDEGQRIERPGGLAAIVEQIDGGARFLELAPRAFHAFAQSAARQGADHAQNPLPVVANRLLAGDQLVVSARRRGRKAAQRLHTVPLDLMFLSPARGRG